MSPTKRLTNLRILNPVTATTREIAEVLNRTINGGLNSIGYVTLLRNSTQTTHLDPRYSPESIVFWAGHDHSPYHHNPWVDETSTNGTMIINHDNQGHDAEFAYLIIG